MVISRIYYYIAIEIDCLMEWCLRRMNAYTNGKVIFAVGISNGDADVVCGTSNNKMHDIVGATG